METQNYGVNSIETEIETLLESLYLEALEQGASERPM